MTRNSLQVRVAWAGGTPLSSLGASQPIRLRFVMEDVWLYSFEFVRGVWGAMKKWGRVECG